jgi:hypothetical protein
MKKIIGDWEINDWDGQWPLQVMTERGDELEVRGTNLAITMQLAWTDDMGNQNIQAESMNVPIELLKQLLQRHGLEIVGRDQERKTPDGQ